MIELLNRKGPLFYDGGIWKMNTGMPWHYVIEAFRRWDWHNKDSGGRERERHYRIKLMIRTSIEGLPGEK